MHLPILGSTLRQVAALRNQFLQNLQFGLRTRALVLLGEAHTKKRGGKPYHEH
jgi:hypothetical protein